MGQLQAAGVDLGEQSLNFAALPKALGIFLRGRRWVIGDWRGRTEERRLRAGKNRQEVAFVSFVAIRGDRAC